jgi:hypothetical protein
MLNLDGAGYTILYSFVGNGGDGANPAAGLLQGSDGALYGSTFNGGSKQGGMVFRLMSLPLMQISFSQPSLAEITVSGLDGQSCRLLTSTDLANWSPVATNQVASSGTAVFDVNLIPGETQRFYRAASLRPSL